MRSLVELLVILLLVFVGCQNSNEPSNKSSNKYNVVGKIYLSGTDIPISGAVISCENISSTSNIDGAFSLQNIPEGSHTLTANKNDYEAFSETINLNGNMTKDIYLTSSIKTTNLSGIVSNSIDGPIQGAKVSIRNLVDFTDANGRYQLPNIPQGTDSIKVEHSKYLKFTSGIYLYSSDKQFDVKLLKEEEITTEVFADAHVDQTQPDKNFGSNSELRIQGEWGNGYNNKSDVYLKPEIPSILSDSRVTLIDGYVALYVDRKSDFSWDVNIYTVEQDWQESAITWNKQPSISLKKYGYSIQHQLTADGSIADIGYRKAVPFAVLNDLVKKNSNYGVVITTNGQYYMKDRRLCSKENQNYRPICKFIIRY